MNQLEGAAKTTVYGAVLQELRGLLTDGGLSRLAAMATTAALLQERLSYFHWTGFYRVVRPQLLEIGPYQGHVACLWIPFAKGVCGASAKQAKTIVVSDVQTFPGYIACASSSRSEIVVPVIDAGAVTAVLDVDSDLPAAFDATDAEQLQQVVDLLVRHSASERLIR